MNPYIKQVQPLENYQLELLFENGERRIFDMTPYLQRGVFVKLQNRSLFQAARVVAGSVDGRRTGLSYTRFISKANRS